MSNTTHTFVLANLKRETDVDRIAACARAMRGIKNPEQWVEIAKSHIEASENQAAQNRRLQSERDELLAALRELVELKRMKDEGTTLLNRAYLVRNPIAWQRAKELIEKFEKP